ncbi:MAG: hypothetical protein C0617_00600 [Desulfuromonas sp.]|uniref:PAS domain S-box protein n=1 Tax=Desulfuromonas sp. TaxID=892 RepID=UPI000CC88ECF|nr:PAS domain S-box protein [Desulfuromonas sp.]PLX86605.1 MAG: hypothetical protein C0617_00600 [Desulfuromonas sp.]
MQYRLSDLIDLPAVRTMVDSLYAAAGIPVGMIDVDGTVLLAAGWQDICTKFHRVHPATARRCRESDAYIDRYLTGDAELPSCGFIEYTCQNGLIDACMPVIIEGNHLANLYLGQFLYQPPDEAFFRAQALEHGFDEEVYLEALRRVPIFSRERVEEILAFHSHFLDVLIRMGLERLRYLTANRELEFREAFEKLIANISTRFVELPSEEINQGIDLALQELGEFIAADRSYVFLRTPGGMHASCTNEVCAEGVPAAREEKQAVNLSDLPWYLEKIRSQKVLYVPRVDDLPSEAQTEKELWQAHGIRTLAGVPIYVAEQQIGLLGFDSVHAEKSWDDDTLNRLKTVGEIFGSAIARERSERALRESEEWFRTIFEASAVGMATFSAGSKIDHVNPALCRLLGYSQAELQQLTVADVTHPEDLELTARQIDEATAGQRRHIEMEKRYLRKNGSTVWGQVSVAYLPQAGHGPMRSVAMIQDITERKEVERRLQESEKRLALALQVSNQGVWDLNTETGETYFSSRYYQMLGYESDELEASYESWAELLHPDDREQAIATAEDFFDNGRSYMAEFRMRTKDGAYRHILSCCEAVERTREGQPLRLLGTHMDITERVEYRRQL